MGLRPGDSRRPIGVPRSPRSLTEPHGASRSPPETHGDPRRPPEPHGDSRSPRRPTETHGAPRSPTEPHGAHGAPRSPTEPHGAPRSPRSPTESHRASLLVHCPLVLETVLWSALEWWLLYWIPNNPPHLDAAVIWTYSQIGQDIPPGVSTPQLTLVTRPRPPSIPVGGKPAFFSLSVHVSSVFVPSFRFSVS